jgi:hypothetical protein
MRVYAQAIAREGTQEEQACRRKAFHDQEPLVGVCQLPHRESNI